MCNLQGSNIKASTLFKSAALLWTSLLFIGCGGSQSSSETDPLNDVRDLFPTAGLIDLKDYIPQTDKNVSFTVSDSSVNVNGEVIYTTSDGIITADSTHDGLDLDDYISFGKYIHLDSYGREALSSMEFGSNYLMHTIDQEETPIPRFYDDNDTVALTLQFIYTADFSASTDSSTIYYTDAYESNASICTLSYVGDYEIAGNHYEDAVRLSCFANRSKGGTVDGVSRIAYDYNYTSDSILLPSMGIVSVDYESADANYSIKWQP
jgi:hypothetical protein